jgi:hypothetical protein
MLPGLREAAMLPTPYQHMADNIADIIAAVQGVIAQCDAAIYPAVFPWNEPKEKRQRLQK